MKSKFFSISKADAIELLPIFLFCALANGMLIYSLSLQLASNFYYSVTQFASIYCMCLMFIGHGLGGVLAGKFFVSSSKSLIYKLIFTWLICIITVFIFIFTLYPTVIQDIHLAANRSEKFLGLISYGMWAKVIFVALIQLPIFLNEGMIFSACYGFARSNLAGALPLLVGASTLGSALGYLAGIGIAYAPGINAIFAVILSMLVALLLSKKLWFRLALPVLVFLIAITIQLDNRLESLRNSANSVYANIIGGEVIAYDWSRFQKSEYIKHSVNGVEGIRTTLNGRFQVMASKDERLVYHLGYGAVYNPAIVKNANILIVGSGMGRGVQVALNNGARQIRAVDIEPSFEKQYAVYKDMVNDIYAQPQVSYHTMDGREAINHFHEKYDLIMIEGVVNTSAMYALNIMTEGYLQTAEAMRGALNNITENGIVVVLSYASNNSGISLLNEFPEISDKGFKVKHIYVLVNDELGGFSYYVSVLCISRDEAKLDSIAQVINNVNLDLLSFKEPPVIKTIEPDPSFNSITDDRPFPYLSGFSQVSFLLYFALICLGAIVLLFICAYRRGKVQGEHWKFSLLGFALMMCELYMINKFSIFPGDSMLSFALGSAIFLVFFSIGNSISNRLNISRLLFCALWLFAFLLFALTFGAGVTNFPLAGLYYQAGLMVKISVMILLLAPLAILCGTFFPKMILRYVQPDKSVAQMGYAMILDSLGVCVGFCLFTVISCMFGYNYNAPLVVAAYLLLGYTVFNRGRS